MKKAYIQDLCGDENPIDIDCAILQCMLQDAIFEALMSKKTDTNVSGITYLIVGIGYKGKVYKIFGHRLAWLIVTGVWPNEIDHINGDGRDNKWKNLKDGSREDNNKNHKRQVNNSSGLPGVSFVKSTGKWRVFGNKEGKQIHLKVTRDFFEACCVRKRWEFLNGYSERHGTQLEDSFETRLVLFN